MVRLDQKVDVRLPTRMLEQLKAKAAARSDEATGNRVQVGAIIREAVAAYIANDDSQKPGQAA